MVCEMTEEEEKEAEEELQIELIKEIARKNREWEKDIRSSHDRYGRD